MKALCIRCCLADDVDTCKRGMFQLAEYAFLIEIYFSFDLFFADFCNKEYCWFNCKENSGANAAQMKRRLYDLSTIVRLGVMVLDE